MAAPSDPLDTVDPADPRHLTPEQRLDELSSLPAAGVRRLLALRHAPVIPPPMPPPQIDPEFSEIRLDVSGHKSIHVPRG